MTLAQAGALDRANLDLVVARVEDDELEIDAPAVDADLGVGEADEGVADAVAAIVDGGDVGDQSVGSGQSDESGTTEEIAVSEEDSILTDDDSSEVSLPSTSTDDDNDSIISETNSPRRIINIGKAPTVVTDAIVGDDQSAEADANAEVEVIENRLNDTVPWEEYHAPPPDGGDDDDGGDGGDDGDDEDDDGDLDLRPEEREQLRFETNLAVRLQTFEETQVVENQLVQMLTHG